MKIQEQPIKSIIIKYSFILDIALFMIITYVFHKLWWQYSTEIKSLALVSNTADWLARRVFEASFWIIRHTYDTNVIDEAVNTLRFSNRGWIAVNESCSGLKQFYQILVLFLLFPGPIKHKLWFIPLSIIIMHITNVMRIVVLGMITLWLPDYWDFSHDWILRPFFYVVLFLLWVWWVERYGGFTDFLKKRKLFK
jgi:exosortase/archaeosortase family protein